MSRSLHRRYTKPLKLFAGTAAAALLIGWAAHSMNAPTLKLYPGYGRCPAVYGRMNAAPDRP